MESAKFTLTVDGDRAEFLEWVNKAARTQETLCSMLMAAGVSHDMLQKVIADA